MEKKAWGSRQLDERGASQVADGGGSKDPAGCGVVIRVEEGLDPKGDVRVASSPFPSSPLPLHTSPLPFSLLYNCPFLLPSSTLPSPPHFSGLLPSSQGSGRSPAEPSTRRASAAVCPALANFCGAERRAVAGCAAPWCTNARLTAPWTASAPARRRPRCAAPVSPSFGPLFWPPEAHGPRHLGSSSPEVSRSPEVPLACPSASQHLSQCLATAPRALDQGCACGDPGEAQAGLRTQGGPIWSTGSETVQSVP